jgi:hypothetical protein
MSKRLSQSQDSSILQTFISVFALVGSSIFAIQFFRSDSPSESWDKLIYICALSFGALFIFLGNSNLNRTLSKKSSIFGTVAFLVIVIGTAGIEKHESIASLSDLSHFLWLGFGIYVLLTALLLVPFSWRLITAEDRNPQIKKLLWFLAFVASTLSALSFIQNSRSIIDPYHTSFIINELYASLAGNLPYLDFIPQYQLFYTYLLELVSLFIGPSKLLAVAILGISILAIIAIAIGIYLARQCLPNKSWIVSILMIVSIVSVTPFPTREGFSGSIAALISGLPVRILPGMLIVLCSFVILGKAGRSSNLLYFFVLGIFSGANIWNSQDFGIGIILATTVTFIFIPVASNIIRVKFFLSYLLGSVLGFTLYVILIQVFVGKSINFSYVGFYLRQFGSGHGAEPIITPGPVLIVLPLLVALVVGHYLVSKGANNLSENFRDELLRNSFIGFQLSTWATIGFNYYLNRSFASGQMQILFLPLSVSFVIFIGSLARLHASGQQDLVGLDLEKPIWHKKQKYRVSNISFRLIVSLILASFLMLPNPKVEVNRLLVGNDAAIKNEIALVQIERLLLEGKKYASDNNSNIGYFGLYGNYFEFRTGIDSLALLSTPADLFLSTEATDKSCDFIRKKSPQYLFLGPEAFTVFEKQEMKLCGIYAIVDLDGFPMNVLAQRI